MNREILFRGFAPDKNGTEKVFINGEWIKGKWVEGSLHIQNGELKKDGSQELEHRILGRRGEKDYVIPETVGQYTGLTDKNGKEIFEGDIVNADEYTFVVKFGKCGGVSNSENYGYMGFYFDGFDEITKDCMSYGLRNDMCFFIEREIIGNIHDNPELLEKGAE